MSYNYFRLGSFVKHMLFVEKNTIQDIALIKRGYFTRPNKYDRNWVRISPKKNYNNKPYKFLHDRKVEIL